MYVCIYYMRYAICFMVFMLYRFIKWTFECLTMGHLLTPSLWCCVNHQKANLNSKLSTAMENRQRTRESRERKRKENSNALRRTASFVFVFECIRRRFIFMCCGVGICGLLRHKQPRKTTHPHGWRPLERAYLLLGTWHFGIHTLSG